MNERTFLFTKDFSVKPIKVKTFILFRTNWFLAILYCTGDFNILKSLLEVFLYMIKDELILNSFFIKWNNCNKFKFITLLWKLDKDKWIPDINSHIYK